MSNPVGTGPYRLAQWVRSSKIVLEANPIYRGFVWDFTPGQPGDDKLVAQMKGKTMPAGRAASRSPSWRRTRRAGSRSRTASSTS